MQYSKKESLSAFFQIVKSNRKIDACHFIFSMKNILKMTTATKTSMKRSLDRKLLINL